MKIVRLAAAAVAMCVCFAAAAQEINRFPFVLPWDDSSDSVVNVGAFNPTPAGANGFIRARDGHFYDEKGKRVRFLGVDMAADSAFPTHSDAEKIAGRLHKYGINIVRLHHMDAGFSKPNLFDPAFGDTQHLNKEAIDRLDYFIYQLKQHGIYSNINLKVSRTFTAKDGLPETDKLGFAGKPADYFMPRMIELQKGFAQALLTHENAYTHLRYVEEPAVAVVEINNENSIVGAPWESLGGGIKDLPPAYQDELKRQWNEWLKKRYKDTRGLTRAWSAADKPLGPNRLLNADFSQGAEHWNLELNTAPAAAKMELPEQPSLPPGVNGHPIRIDVTALGTQNWHIQFHQTGIDLTDGEPYSVSFWARADRPRSLPVYAGLDKDDYHQVGLSDTAHLTTAWQKFTYSFTANRTEKSHNRLTFVLGDALGTVDLLGISLRPGVETSFPVEARLENGTFPLGQPAANPAGQDWIAFLMDVERHYMTEMRDYLKQTLKAQANITGSQSGWGGLAGLFRESQSDFADMHAYWQHPVFPHQQWDPKDWRIPNTAMTADTEGGTLPGLARYRLAGKPYTVSEYSHPAPNDFQAESVPLLASFAAVQDWDGFYLFDYGMDRGQNKIGGWFAVDANPAKMAFLPAAACIFLRNDVALANEELRLRVPADSVVSLIGKNRQDATAEWEAADIHSLDALNHRLSVSFTARKKSDPVRTEEHPAGEFINKPETRSPISWNPSKDKPVFSCDSPSSKVIVGMVGGETVSVPGWQAQVAEGGNNFAALTLTAMDGKPIDHSFSLLLTAVSRVENTGMRWNADRTSVGDTWGTGPTLAEGVSAAISIHTLVTSAIVYALDGTGKRMGKVDSKLYGSELTFPIDAKYKTIWYEVEASIKR